MNDRVVNHIEIKRNHPIIQLYYRISLRPNSYITLKFKTYLISKVLTQIFHRIIEKIIANFRSPIVLFLLAQMIFVHRFKMMENVSNIRYYSRSQAWKKRKPLTRVSQTGTNPRLTGNDRAGRFVSSHSSILSPLFHVVPRRSTYLFAASVCACGGARVCGSGRGDTN